MNYCTWTLQGRTKKRSSESLTLLGARFVKRIFVWLTCRDRDRRRDWSFLRRGKLHLRTCNRRKYRRGFDYPRSLGREGLHRRLDNPKLYRCLRSPVRHDDETRSEEPCIVDRSFDLEVFADIGHLACNRGEVAASVSQSFRYPPRVLG